MKMGLSISVVDPDPDYNGIEVEAANERYAGSAFIMAGLSALSEFATAIKGFPANPNDEREFVFGVRKPGWVTGYCGVRLYCTDGSGHAVLDLEIDDDKDLNGPWKAKLSFKVLAADIDEFTDALRRIESAREGKATLPLAR